MSDAKKTLRLTQVKSSIGRKADQGKTVDQVDNESIRGMIFKVKHLIKVEEI